jgi:hypothetical protein
MKKIFLYTLFLVTSVLMLNSCRKDLSTLDIAKIKGVSFDTTGQSSLSVFQFDKLIVKPKINIEGVNAANLKYEWRINAGPNLLDYRVIGTERDLEFEVKAPPTKANEFYQVLYVVTDQSNDLQYVMAWPLAIRNSIGEGLVIATSADGINTDISHIMSPLVTSNYSSESVKRNVFSGVNGTTIPGILKQLRFTKLSGAGEIMMGISDQTMVAIKTLDYTQAGLNESLFFLGVPNRKNQLIGGLTQSDVYVGNGKLTAVWLELSKKFGLPFDAKYTVPNHVALNGNSDYPLVVISFYYEEKGIFVYQPSVSFGDKNMHPLLPVAQGAFDPSATPNKINLAAGVTQAGEFLHVLKDKSTNKVGLYMVEGGKYDDNWNQLPPAPKAFYDLSNAPDIQNAVHYVLLDDQKVLYYATKTKIYAMLYGSATPTFSERYTAPAGEEITTLQVYRQADYPKRFDGWDPPYISTNNKQLIMSTYNNTEGKVYIMPMKNIGLGNIDEPNIKVYNGFKRISAIGTQL